MNNPTVAQLPGLLPLQSLPIAWNFDAAGADFGAPLTWTGKGSTSNNSTAALSVSPALVAGGYSASASCFGASLAFKGPGQFGNYSYNFPGGINLTNAVSLSMAVSISKVFSSGLGASPYIELALLSGTNDVIQSQTFPAPVVGAWTVYSLSLINNAPNNLADVQQISLDFGTGPEGSTFNTSLVYIDAVTITQLGPTATATATKTATNSPTVTSSPTVTNTPTATTSPTSTSTVTSTPTVTNTSTPTPIATWTFGSVPTNTNYWYVAYNNTCSSMATTSLSAFGGSYDTNAYGLDILLPIPSCGNDTQAAVGSGASGLPANFTTSGVQGTIKCQVWLNPDLWANSASEGIAVGLFVQANGNNYGGCYNPWTDPDPNSISNPGGWTTLTYSPSGGTWTTDKTNVTAIGIEINEATGPGQPGVGDVVIDNIQLY